MIIKKLVLTIQLKLSGYKFREECFSENLLKLEFSKLLSHESFMFF